MIACTRRSSALGYASSRARWARWEASGRGRRGSERIDGSERPVRNKVGRYNKVGVGGTINALRNVSNLPASLWERLWLEWKKVLSWMVVVGCICSQKSEHSGSSASFVRGIGELRRVAQRMDDRTSEILQRTYELRVRTVTDILAGRCARSGLRSDQL